MIATIYALFEVFVLLCYIHNFLCASDVHLACVRGVMYFFTLHGIYPF